MICEHDDFDEDEDLDDYSDFDGDELEPGDFRGPAPLPEPTDAPPGSEAKIRILEARAAAGQVLFHPDDLNDLPEGVGFQVEELGNGEVCRAGLLEERGPGDWAPAVGDIPKPKPKPARTPEQAAKKRTREQTLRHRIAERDRKRRATARRSGRVYYPRDPRGQLYLWSWPTMFVEWELMELELRQQQQQHEEMTT